MYLSLILPIITGWWNLHGLGNRLVTLRVDTFTGQTPFDFIVLLNKCAARAAD